MKKHFTIREYGRIYCDDISEPKQDGENIRLPHSIFEEIKQFILSPKAHKMNFYQFECDENVEFLKPNISKKQEYFTAQNFVGLIQTHNGFTIEILPKIYMHKDEKNDKNIEATRKIFLKMLKALKDSPFKTLNLANLSSTKMPLFEIFISYFIDEVFKLVHKGLKAGYVLHENNLKYLKGKLLFNENIKHNICHKERFFTQYEEFTKNRPENRLIKSTLYLLSNLSRSNSNQRKLSELLMIFEEIKVSRNIVKDFQKVQLDRTMIVYKLVINLCKMFLQGKSITNFKGRTETFALFFPMEKIFEDFVASQLKKHHSTEWEISTQDKGKYLITEPNKKFALRPDIVMKRGSKEDKVTIILDTKWKRLINNEGNNYGISQADLYQLFAYGKKYDVKEVCLIYPYNEDFDGESYANFQFACRFELNGVLDVHETISKQIIELTEYQYEENLVLKILLWDLSK